MNPIRISLLILPLSFLLSCQQTTSAPRPASADSTTTAVNSLDKSGEHSLSEQSSLRRNPTTADISTEGFAVLELFTSEGCSSCPPAEQVLSEFVDRQQQNSLPIYALEFHVDYWDYLGWPDPYASNKHTKRQRGYAARFKQRSVYTPQMIVNGETGFVGSSRSKANVAIESALGSKPDLKLQLKLNKSANSDQLTASYLLSNLQPNLDLNLALIQRSVKVDVPRGENAGKKLSHRNVVRGLTTISLTATSGTSTLKIPADLNRSEILVIGFVQQAQQGKILAAAQAD